MKTECEPARACGPARSFSRILVPSDFSPGSNLAFKHALELRQKFGAHIDVVHVLEPTGAPRFNGIAAALTDLEKQPATARRELRAWVNCAARSDRGARLIVRTGLPAHEIVQAAEDLNADLIVMASSGLTGWRHFCIGSTAEQVVRTAPCSVLVVRAKEQHFTC